MRTLVVYESMYGNTHAIAAQIAEGLRSVSEVEVVAAHEVRPEQVAAADLVVVGGPTHAHGMSSTATRKSARDAANTPGSHLALDTLVEGAGLREWFGSLGSLTGTKAAAFDTRLDAAILLTGHAAKGIAHRLRHHGCTLVADPESFLVNKANELIAGEAERATHWGHALALTLTPSHPVEGTPDVHR